MAYNKRIRSKIRLKPVTPTFAYMEVSVDDGVTWTIVDQLNIPTSATENNYTFPQGVVIDIDNPLISLRVRLDPQTTTTTTSTTSSSTTTFTTSTSTSSTTSTISTTSSPTAIFRYASSADAAAIDNANIGDYLLTAPNLTSEGSIDIRPAFNNTFTLDSSTTCKKILIKGGTYDRISLDLPGLMGTVSCPIIITNYEGQVRCKSFIIKGMSYFKMTGKYDSTAGTGDANFRGHLGTWGYNYSAGQYGFLVSNDWDDEESFMLGVTGSGAYQMGNFELEFIEAANGGFSNVFKWDNQGAVVDNMQIHDLYVHDIHGEGSYFASTGGGTQHDFTNSWIYNNRFLRCGNEAIQFGHMQKGCKIYHNVTNGAHNWRSPFGEYQDNNIQIDVRNGDIEVRDNFIFGAGEKWFNFFVNNTLGVTRSGTFTLQNNVMLYNRGPLDIYLGTGGTGASGVNLKVIGNYMGKRRFIYPEAYTDSRATFAPHCMRIAAANDIELRNNIYDTTGGKSTFYSVNDYTPVVTSINNTTRTLPDVEFINYMGFPSGFDYTYLEQWASRVGDTWGNEDQFGASGTRKGEAVVYTVGYYVMHKSKLYKCLATNSEVEPGVTAGWATSWELQTFTKPDSTTTTIPPDDVRLVSTSYYNAVGVGLLDNPTYNGTTTTTTTSTSTTTFTTTTTTSTTTSTTTTTAAPLAERLSLGVKDNGTTFDLSWGHLASELTGSPLFVGIGSSTLAGTGASSTPTSVGGLLQTQLSSIASGLGIFANNAFSGLDTQAAMPTDSSINVKDNRNITMATSARPTGIVIAFPTNDIINGLTPQQFRDNTLAIYDEARSRNIPAFVISVQPRTSATLSQQQDLVTAYNMIKSAIPVESFVDVFDALRDTGSSNPADINPSYNADGIHVNDTGHSIIYNALWTKINALFQNPTYTQYVIQSATVSNIGDIPGSWSTFDTINTSNTVSKTYSKVDNNIHAYRIIATKSGGGTTTVSNTRYVVQPRTYGSVDQTIQVDFSIDTVTAPPTDWNNLSVAATPTAGLTYVLFDNTITTTAVNLTVTKAFSGAGTGGSNTGVYPIRVMQDSWNIANSSTARAQLHLTGLDASKVYDFEFMCSRSNTNADRFLTINIPDTTLVDKTGSLNADVLLNTANDNNLLIIKDVIPSVSGDLYIDVYATGSLGYLNAMVMRRRATGIVTTTSTSTTTSTTTTTIVGPTTTSTTTSTTSTTSTSTSSTTSTSTTTSAPVNPQFLTTIDGWNAYVKLPDDYYTDTAKLHPTIVFSPGSGEVGSDASKLLVNGPAKFLQSTWNGTVINADGVSEQPIIISLQQAITFQKPASTIDPKVSAILSTYRVDPRRLSVTGFSAGGYMWGIYVTGDTYPGGPYTYANKIASFVSVQGVVPDDNTPYPNVWDNTALGGVKYVGFEQAQDNRGMPTIVARMNAAVASSAIYYQTNFCDGSGQNCGAHGYTDNWYDPTKTFTLNGKVESIYAYMLRQVRPVTTTTTTTTTSSTSTSSTTSTTTTTVPATTTTSTTTSSTTTTGTPTTSTTSTSTSTTSTSTSSTTSTSTTTAAPIAQFNFGPTTSTAVAGWTSVFGDPLTAVRTATDSTTGYTVTSLGTYNGSSTNTAWGQAGGSCAVLGGKTTGSNTGIAPDNVLAGYWFNTKSAQTSPARVNGVRLSNLVAGATYSLGFLASRTTANSRLCTYDITDNAGSTTTSPSFQARDNTTAFVTVSRVANGSGIIDFGCHGDLGSADQTNDIYGFLNGLTVQRTA